MLSLAPSLLRALSSSLKGGLRPDSSASLLSVIWLSGSCTPPCGITTTTLPCSSLAAPPVHSSRAWSCGGGSRR